MGEAASTGPGRRERKALATRHRMLDAAQALFIRDGYAATTMTGIAEMADVAVQTVYAVFGAKRAILAELLRVGVTGDDQRAPLREREDWQALEREIDPGRQVALLAVIATRIGGRIGALYEVLAAAAGADPDIAQMYQRQQHARYADQHRLARSLSRRGALRPGLSAARATDIMWTLASPRTHHALVTQREWATDEYERWLADMLTSALLTEPATDGTLASHPSRTGRADTEAGNDLPETTLPRSRRTDQRNLPPGRRHP